MPFRGYESQGSPPGIHHEDRKHLYHRRQHASQHAVTRPSLHVDGAPIMLLAKASVQAGLRRRFLSQTDMVAQSLGPISAPTEGMDRGAFLKEVVLQIEASLQSSYAPPTFQLVRVRSLRCKTLLASEMGKDVPKEFYTLGLECRGSLCRVIGALRIRPMGTSISIIMDSKEVVDPCRNALVWLFSTLFPDLEIVPKDTEGNLRFGCISAVAFLGSLFIGYQIASAVGGISGPFIGIVGAISFTAGLIWSAHSIRDRQLREKQEFFATCRLALAKAYQSVDPSFVPSAVPPSNEPPQTGTSGRPRID